MSVIYLHCCDKYVDQDFDNEQILYSNENEFYCYDCFENTVLREKFGLDQDKLIEAIMDHASTESMLSDAKIQEFINAWHRSMIGKINGAHEGN